MTAISGANSIGYGPSNQWQNLLFNGDERKYEQWEVRFLWYLKIKKLKDITVPADATDPSTDANAQSKVN